MLADLIDWSKLEAAIPLNRSDLCEGCVFMVIPVDCDRSMWSRCSDATHPVIFIKKEQS